MVGGGSQRLLSINPTTVIVVLLLGLWLLLGCDNSYGYTREDELFDRVVDDYNKKNLTERMAEFQFYQTVEAVRYLHSRQVCLRKPELDLLADDVKCQRPLTRVSDHDSSLSKHWDCVNLHCLQ